MRFNTIYCYVVGLIFCATLYITCIMEELRSICFSGTFFRHFFVVITHGVSAAVERPRATFLEFRTLAK